MQGIPHLRSEVLATLGYKDLSLISETEIFLIYHVRSPDIRPVLVKTAPILRLPVAVRKQLDHDRDVIDLPGG
ncbi:MAG: hypothetical protein ABW104_03750 [Candidatus Thiodiazotropha sp. 6PLUC2]